MKHIPYPSIKQFRDVVNNVKHKTAYVGMDNDGNPIMDRNKPLPTLKFIGTEKIHGTNLSIIVDNQCNIQYQSRSNIITPQQDNAGSAMYSYGINDVWLDIASDVIEMYPDNSYDKNIMIAGEFSGGNIQKGVAITGLHKMFIVFDIALADKDGQKQYLKMDDIKIIMSRYTSADKHLYCIYDFPTYEIEIDFNNPYVASNEFVRITDSIELCSPVGLAFGVTGIGEGVVWKCVTSGYDDSGYWMKVKGNLHSESKVKILPTVDIERFNNIKELAARLAHNGRLEQFHQQVFNTLNGGTTDMTKMGDFIKAVIGDIFKEDIDIIVESGYTGKEISNPVAAICRQYITNYIGI